ncbi:MULTISPECIES: YceI family protein [Shewanella]|jgi:polyisoprenoid-binding protein YceI|uniref:YceI family protein n=1 Tax=Shewanella TaxID=22 RepID=UPI00064664C2|nr:MULTISPECIES: YceI family protein [Shewanella]MCT8869816.1 YceI family protein [Shewanella xiamenensis]MDI5836153.1 YceI family protein [Shewanella xiamenensis]MDI5839809.1 YceI family protein [Shewanella xiamenensis]MDI5843525.1 YceI family protein [Shewanella xiamenensis]MDI5847960.1 YceI family protein [Shewanella xiamenensis]
MKKQLLAALIGGSLLVPMAASAADYVIDREGAHASITFKVSHLGYSYVVGRFNDFSGDFSYDAKNPAAAKVNVKVNTLSVDSNHAERDKHIRSADFLNAAKFAEATFVSTSVEDKGNGDMVIKGNFTLNGVTKPLAIQAHAVGEGQDPWGGYRAGFTGTTTFAMKDYGIKMDLGPASANVELDLVVEGVRK